MNWGDFSGIILNMNNDFKIFLLYIKANLNPFYGFDFNTGVTDCPIEYLIDNIDVLYSEVNKYTSESFYLQNPKIYLAGDQYEQLRIHITQAHRCITKIKANRTAAVLYVKNANITSDIALYLIKNGGK